MIAASWRKRWPGVLHGGFTRACRLQLAPAPIGELPSYVSWIDREKIAHIVERKEGFAIVLEQPELGLDEFAPSVEGSVE